MTNEMKDKLTGNWISIATEVRPSSFKNPDGTLKPFYLSRHFTYSKNDQFELDIINYADAYGKIPLVKMFIKGHVVWQGDHPIADGAQNVEFIADLGYEVTPVNAGFVDVLNKIAAEGYNKWEVNVKQDIFKKTFTPFGLSQGQVFREYDLIHLTKDMLFWGARHIDGRGFDTEANRPTNLQIPLIRK